MGRWGVRQAPAADLYEHPQRARDGYKLVPDKILSIPNPRTEPGPMGAAGSGLGPLERISGSRTSWLARETGARRRWLKTYRYPLPWGPVRGAFRNTFLALSRAQREFRALEHLAGAGIQPALAVDLRERRWLGFLLESQLVLEDFGGSDLARLLADGAVRDADLAALGAFVGKLHGSGLRDPDLKARNLLLRHEDGAPIWAKIDASSSRISPRGDRWDRARISDVVALHDDLHSLGLEQERIDMVLNAMQPSPAAQRRIRSRAASRG